MDQSILRVNNDATRLATPEDIKLLKECDDVTTYKECGWHCATGWKGDRRIVHVHFQSEEDMNWALYPERMRKDSRALDRGRHVILYGR